MCYNAMPQQTAMHRGKDTRAREQHCDRRIKGKKT